MESVFNYIEYFKVENFKKFASLEISNIKQLNLIVGENNIGKSTLIESLCYNESLPDLLSNLITLLEWRRIDDVNIIDFDYINLYRNNTKVSKINFIEKRKNSNNAKTISLNTKLVSDLEPQDIATLRKKVVKANVSKFIATLEVENKKQINYLKDFEGLTRSENYIPLIPFYPNTYSDLMEFYSSNFQNSKPLRKDLINSLKIFIPDIEDLEISTGIIPGENYLIVWRENFDSPFLINSFGDGTNKMLRLLLEIKKCRNNRIMVDEIDCGIHYSKLKDFFKIIIQACLNDNVQLFATTHSKECIENYMLALDSLDKKNEGNIIRLANTKVGVKGYSIGYDEINNSLISESEIR